MDDPYLIVDRKLHDRVSILKKKKNQIKQTIFDNSLSIHKFEELLKDVGLDYCIQYL